MRRVTIKVCDSEAQNRLKKYRDDNGFGPYRASVLADVIWPKTDWVAAQGAGAAASRVLKRLGCRWTANRENWGWILEFHIPKAKEMAGQ